MTGRARVLAIVAAAAALAVAGTVTITWLQTRGETTQRPGAVTKPRAGVPPLTLDFGVRSDPRGGRTRAVARRCSARASARPALAVFERYHSVDAQIGGGVRALAGGRARHPEAARRRASAQRGRAAPSRLGALWSGPRGRCREAVPARRDVVRGHAGGGDGRGRPLPEVRAEPADAHSRRRLAVGADRGRAAAHPRSGMRGTPTSPRSFATASRSGRSAAASPRSGSSRPLQRSIRRRRRPDRGRRRALHETRSGACVLAPRAVDGGLPACGRRAPASRHPPALDGQHPEGRRPVPARGRRRAALALRDSGAGSSFRSSLPLGPSKENMSRTAYGGLSAAAGIVRHLRRNVCCVTSRFTEGSRVSTGVGLSEPQGP